MPANISLIPLLWPFQAVKVRGKAGVFQVTKQPTRNGVNVSLRDENGRPWKVSISMVETTDEKFELKVDDIQTKLFLGTKVRVKDPRFLGVYVVIDQKIDALKVAKLGGDNGRFVRVSSGNLELVED